MRFIAAEIMIPTSLVLNNPTYQMLPTTLFNHSYGRSQKISINCAIFSSTHLSFQVGAHKGANSTSLTLENIVWPSPDDKIPFWEKSVDSSNAIVDVPVTVNKDSDLVHVVHVTAEMAPVAKVGGLGDVVTGLARACMARGHTVNVMLPLYECLPKQQLSELTLICTYNSYHDGKWIPTNAYRAVASGIPVILIEPDNHFFKGQRIYGGSYDELEAYLYFTRACLEWMQKPRIVLTIHNMEHYGECRKEQFCKSGLNADVFATTDKALDDRTIGHNPERLSLLKGGIVYSNAVITVSPTYLKETLNSGWLSGTLIKYCDKYSGILNGIDIALWNPAADVFLPAVFTAQKLDGKAICKQYVQRGLGLPAEPVEAGSDRKPLVVCVTRKMVVNHFQICGWTDGCTGKAATSRVEKEFEGLAALHNQGPSIRILLIHSEELSHMLYAAADMVLVPSIYEPCGLAQMIGMRYGAVPVVRRTGGLADTVFDMDDHSNPEMSNGFVFEGIDEGSLNWSLERAFKFYFEKPDEWKKLVQKIMEIDNSWNNAAGKYITIYNSVKAR
ncbi:hypothetical protein Cgig2_024423 [Carnegiea gigantea]|uniref:starch synthase n=1 Tax=Carnegiea gigantea TaxID=171969 RepID=A0A9Q1KMA0_9CARY|nr:hypothetical protein Cgig2_024423 [Carnegiea gigantea]